MSHAAAGPGWKIHFLEAEGELSPWREHLITQADRALTDASRYLPLPKLDVLFDRVDGWVIPELGHGGRATRRSQIVITLDPGNPNFEKHLGLDLLRTLAHEAHHCARFAALGYSKTFGEAMVTEGLADHFDRELYGGEGQMWNKALSEEQIATLLPRAGALLNEGRYDYNGWFFGNAEAGLPRWAAYTLGYLTVGTYLERHPQERAGRLHATPAAQILDDVRTLFGTA